MGVSHSQTTERKLGDTIWKEGETDAWEATNTWFLQHGLACLVAVLELSCTQRLQWYRVGRKENLGQDSGREEAQQIRIEIGSTENKFLPENSSHWIHMCTQACIHYHLILFFFYWSNYHQAQNPLSAPIPDAEAQNTKEFIIIALGPIPYSPSLNSCD